MTEAARVLPITATLAPPLFDAVEAAALSTSQRVQAELGKLLGDLGVSAEPVVQLVPSDSHDTNHLVRLSVDGRPCRFPPTVIAEALAYVDGTPQIQADGDALLARLQAPAEQVAEVLACVCRAAVSVQPGIVLPPNEDAALRAGLELGVSIAGRDAVANDLVSDGGDPVERLIAARAARTIDVHIDPTYLRVLAAEDPEGEMFPFLRDGLFVELGLPLPPFHFRPDPSLRPAGFAFRINALPTLPRIGLSPETVLVNDTPERLAAEHGIDAEPTLNPATYQPGGIVAEQHKEPLEAHGLTTWDPFGFLILSLGGAVRRGAHALMTREVAASMAEQLGYAFPALGDTARVHCPQDVLAAALRELLLDGVPVRNLRRILELLLRYETVGAADHWPDRIAFVRSGLADAIAFKVARGTATVVVYLLDPEIEDRIAAYRDATGPNAPEDELPERLSAALWAELSYLPPTAQVPAILTQDELRRPLRDLLRHEFPRITVVGYGDLPPDYNVQPVARISWSDPAL